MKSTIIIFSFFIVQIACAQISFQQNGKFGFKNGDKIVIEPIYDYTTDFSEGLACVKYEGKWGYINLANEWVVKPMFNQAQPLRDGLAKVELAGKFGMIGAKGEIWIEPIYTEIEKLYRGYLLKLNNKLGYARKDWPIVPAKYVKIDENRNIVNAKISDSLYDIYTQEELILSRVKESISNWDINDANEVIVIKDGKYGIYNLNIGWVVKPELTFIDRLKCEQYEDYGKNGELVKLYYHYALFENSDAVKVSNETKEIRNQDFKIVNAITHELIIGNLTGYDKLESGKGYKTKTDYRLLGNDQNKLLSEFSDSESDFFDYVISKKDNSYSLLDKKKNKTVLSADHIRPFTASFNIQDEKGTEVNRVKKVEYLPLLIIEDSKGKRIYNVERKRFISEYWDKNAEFILTPNFTIGNDDRAYLIECKQNDRFGFYMYYFLAVKEVDWSSYELLENTSYAVVDSEISDEKFLYSVYKPQNLITTADDFIKSEDWDLESTEWLGERKDVASFIVTLKRDKKGIVTNSNFVFEPIFDEIYLTKYRHVLVTKVDELFGIIDINTGIQLKPRFSNYPDLKKGVTFPVYYVDDSSGLIGVDGHIYPQMDLTFTVESKEKKWGVGYYNYEEGKEDEEVVFLFPPIYKYVQETEKYNYFQAYHKKGKVGLINAFGDVLLPFEYYDFDFHEMDIPWHLYLPGEEIMTAYSKKGTGLVSTTRGVIIPSIFDYIEVFPYYVDDKDVLFLANSKKSNGLYSLNRGEILPPSFTVIENSNERFDYESNHLYVENLKGKRGILNTNGDTLLPIIYDHIMSNQEFYYGKDPQDYTFEMSIGNSKGRWSNKKGQLVPAEFERVYDYFEPDYGLFYFFHTKSKGKEGAYDYFGKELLPCKFGEIHAIDAIYNHKDTIVVYGKIENKYYVNNYCLKDSSVSKDFTMDYYFDHIIGNYGIRKHADETVMYNLFNRNKVASSRDGEIQIPGNYFNLFLQNGKYGATDLKGNVLIQPEFDDATFMEDRIDVMIGYQNGVMYYIYPESNKKYTEEEW